MELTQGYKALKADGQKSASYLADRANTLHMLHQQTKAFVATNCSYVCWLETLPEDCTDSDFCSASQDHHKDNRKHWSLHQQRILSTMSFAIEIFCTIERIEGDVDQVTVHPLVLAGYAQDKTTLHETTVTHII